MANPEFIVAEKAYRGLNVDQKLVVGEAIKSLFDGFRVTVSAKKFGHSRKFKDECDLVSSEHTLKKRKKLK